MPNHMLSIGKVAMCKMRCNLPLHCKSETMPSCCNLVVIGAVWASGGNRPACNGVAISLHVARDFECIPLVKRQQQACGYTAPQLIIHICVYLVWVSLIHRHTDKVRCRNSVASFHPIYSRTIHHRYGVYFVGSVSDWYSALVPAMMCAISCYIILRYNSIRLYGLCGRKRTVNHDKQLI